MAMMEPGGAHRAHHNDDDDDPFLFDELPQPHEHQCTVLWVKGVGLLTLACLILFHTDRVSAVVAAYLSDRNVLIAEEVMSSTQMAVECAIESVAFLYIPCLALVSFLTVQVCSVSVCFYRIVGGARCHRLVSFHQAMAVPLMYLVYQVGSDSVGQLLSLQSNEHYLLSLLKHNSDSVILKKSLMESYLKTVFYFFCVISASLNYCVFVKTQKLECLEMRRRNDA